MVQEVNLPNEDHRLAKDSADNPSHLSFGKALRAEIKEFIGPHVAPGPQFAHL